MSYYTTSVPSVPSMSGLGEVGNACDITQDFDPDKVAALWNTQFQNNNATGNAAGKEGSYWLNAALWRLGYSQAGFDLTATPRGYVTWGPQHGAMWNAWRKARLGSESPNGMWPSVGTKADIEALRALKKDLLENNITGPFDPKVVCVTGQGGGTGQGVPAKCPEGSTGTPPNCDFPKKPKTKTDENTPAKAQEASMLLPVGLGLIALAAVAGLVVAAKKKKAAAAGGAVAATPAKRLAQGIRRASSGARHLASRVRSKLRRNKRRGHKRHHRSYR
jgi:hypothetical protein